jgi:cbb3-type cytochrome oxidase subunit 3
MRDNSRLLGIDMAKRGNRRWLVALVLLVLLAIWAFALADPTHRRETGTVLLWVALAVNFLVFGGYGRWGLVKPFNDCPPGARIDSPLRNDEREKQARDRMHFYAYRTVMVLLLLGYSVFWLRPGLDIATARDFVLGLAAFGMSLPQALLLWSEPSFED